MVFMQEKGNCRSHKVLMCINMGKGTQSPMMVSMGKVR